MAIWTALMTVQWITAINIIESYSELSSRRIILFNNGANSISTNFNHSVLFNIFSHIFFWNINDINYLWISIFCCVSIIRIDAFNVSVGVLLKSF